MRSESKIREIHLQRQACIYVRQSTMVQVQEHQESTRRQYELRSRALALGWSEAQIEVIDEDLGQSASDVGRVRKGYQRLMTAIVNGQIGAVLSVEISRLARQDSEGHKLVEIAALMETLLIDESQVYDARLSDDRLMLGLKVLLSSNEIRLMSQRLQANKVRKAQRGQLDLKLPVGLVNEGEGKIGLDPNEAVQGALRMVFEQYRQTGRQSDVVRYFREQALLFPRHRGRWAGPLAWGQLSLRRVHHILTNPLYAGAYVYGRSERRVQVNAMGELTRKFQERPEEQWPAVQWGIFAGYISRAEYNANQQRLKAAPQRNRRCDGAALLSQIVLCGRCGKPMYTCYSGDGGQASVYVCSSEQLKYADKQCQRIPAKGVDQQISQLLLEALTPSQIELSLSALAELERQQTELHAQWQRQLEGVRYASSLAQRRYELVEPENRLVVRQLERRWEEQLEAVSQMEADYKRFCAKQPLVLTPAQRQRVVALAQDFPSVWQAQTTTWAERKKLLKLLIADVTLTRGTEAIMVQVRWCTNQVETLAVSLPFRGSPKTPAWLVARLVALYQTHTDQQIATILNQEGLRTAYGYVFTEDLVCSTRLRNGLRKA